MPRAKLKDVTPSDGLWIVMADGARARIVTPSENRRTYYTLRQIESPRAHRKSAALASDRPGRGAERATGRRHGMEPRSDPHDDAKQEFVRLVADEINQAGRQEEFSSLALVAPAKLLGALQDKLAPGVARRLVRVIRKDLTRVPDPELGPHLDEALWPVRRRAPRPA